MVATALNLPPAVTRLWNRHGRWLPRLAELILVLLLARALASLVWALIPAPEVAAPAPRATPAANASSGPDIDAIVSANLFGKFEADKPTEVALTEDAPDTRLNLTLLGILAATAERGSRALILAPGSDEKPYAVGDDVIQGAQLRAIFPDRVILARNGQLETLRLKKDNEGTPGPSSRSNIARTGTQPAAGNSGPVQVSEQGAKMLSQIREELLTDPTQASKYVRVQPASRNGQLRGYRLYPGANRSAFTAVGLRPGDLITQVNGIQLNDANTALQMLGQLSQATSLSVVVERGGREQTMNVTLN